MIMLLEPTTSQPPTAAFRAQVVESRTFVGKHAAPRLDIGLYGISLEYLSGGIRLMIPALQDASRSITDPLPDEPSILEDADYVDGYVFTHARAYAEGLRQMQAAPTRLLDIDLGPEE